MPTESSVIELIFQGVDRTQAATAAALKNTKDFAGNVESATQPLADFTVGALKLEASILAAGVAVAGFSIGLATNFQSALVDLQKVLGDTESIERFRDLSIELSETYGIAATDVLNSITNFKQAGFTAEEAAILTKSSLDLVIAGNVEAALSSEQLVAAIKGFGAEAKDSTVIIDLLNEVSNNYAATTGQLLEGFSELSPVAAAAGLSLQETIGVLTPGIEVFQSGSEVANALKTSLIRLSSDTKPVTEALELLGVKQKDANGELRSARDIYFDVAAALQGVDDNQKLYIAGQLAGINQSAKFLAVTEGLSKTLEIASADFDFMGSAAKEVAAQLASAENAANRVAETFKNAFIGIGLNFLDEFTGISDALSAIFQTIRNSAESDEGLGDLVNFVEGELGKLQGVFEAIAANLGDALELADLSGFKNGVVAVSEAVQELFSGLDLSSTEGLAAAITALGGGFEALSEFSAGVLKSFKPLFDQITQVAQGITELDGATFQSIGSLFGFATQLNVAAGAVQSLLPSLEALLGIFLVAQGGGLIGAFGKAGQALTGAAGFVALLGKLGLAGAAGAAGVAVGTAANKITEFATGTSISTGLLNFFTDGLTDVDAQARALEESTGGAAGGMKEIGDAAASTADGTQAAAKGMGDLEGAVGTLVGTQDRAKASARDLSDAYELSATTIGDTSEQIDHAATAMLNAADVADKNAQANERSGGTLSFVSNEYSKAAAEARDYAAAIESITPEVQIARIEAQSEIATAAIKANAEQTVAAFESIGTSVGETAETIRTLYGLLGDENISKFDKLSLKDQIEKENERQDKLINKQLQLIDAQIRSLNAQTEFLRGGDALISIEASGLAPHLQAILHAVLEEVQLKTNSQGLAFLLSLQS